MMIRYRCLSFTEAKKRYHILILCRGEQMKIEIEDLNDCELGSHVRIKLIPETEEEAEAIKEEK